MARVDTSDQKGSELWARLGGKILELEGVMCVLGSFLKGGKEFQDENVL